MSRHRRAAVVGEANEWFSPAEELFARLVHDLRNPLGIIAAFAEALAEAPHDERAELCERLRVNAERALNVLEELALLADLRAGRAEPAQREDCDLDELLDQVVAAVDHRSTRIRRASAGPQRARVPRAHLTCALRAVLRDVLHEMGPDDRVELSAVATTSDVTIRITAAPLADLDLELGGAVASLYGGRCYADRHPATTVICTELRASS